MFRTFQKKGVSFLETLPDTSLRNMVKRADDAYFNKDQPLLTDDEYDILRAFVNQKLPKMSQVVGADPPATLQKVDLPVFMGSLNKVKEPKEIQMWSSRCPGPYVLTPKLDGVSALWCRDRLYTRGNGKQGQDITHLLPLLGRNGIQALQGMDAIVRGELVIKKEAFHSHFDRTSNARNVAAGLINRKRNEDLSDAQWIDFVAYELIHPVLPPNEQLRCLKEWGVAVVPSTTQTSLDPEMLHQTLRALRVSHPYDVDGIVCVMDGIYERPIDCNPEYAVAYKTVLDDQIAESIVVDVIWNISKDGLLKPKIRVEPISIQNVRIEHVTAFNASFVEKHRLGPGAVVRISRSGDVIPHILGVEKGADEPKMPEVPYRWNETHTDIAVLDPENNETVKIKTICKFFRDLNAAGIAEGHVRRLYAAGWRTIPDILRLSPEDLGAVYSPKMAQKIYVSIAGATREAPLSTLMIASNAFGRGIGKRSMDLVLKDFPEIMSSGDSQEEIVHRLSNIAGLGKKTAESIARGIPAFQKFLTDSGMSKRLKTD